MQTSCCQGAVFVQADGVVFRYGGIVSSWHDGSSLWVDVIKESALWVRWYVVGINPKGW
jgi:hypothetical protein